MVELKMKERKKVERDWVTSLMGVGACLLVVASSLSLRIRNPCLVFVSLSACVL